MNEKKCAHSVLETKPTYVKKSSKEQKQNKVHSYVRTHTYDAFQNVTEEKHARTYVEENPSNKTRTCTIAPGGEGKYEVSNAHKTSENIKKRARKESICTYMETTVNQIKQNNNLRTYVQDDETDQEPTRHIQAEATREKVRTYVSPKAHKTMKTDDTETKQKRAHTNQIRKYMTPRVSSASTYVDGKEKDATT